MTDAQIFQLALSVVGSILAAGVGAWLGATFALRRFREERAHDRRLEWYERAVESAARLSRLLSLMAEEMRSGSQEAMTVGWDELEEAYMTFQEHSVESQLYGRASSIRTLKAAAQGFHRVLSGIEAPANPRVLEEAGGQVYSAKLALVQEAREHMGIEPVDRDDFDPGATLPPAPGPPQPD